MPKDNKIDIEFLDHVAIRVKDLSISVEWYQNVLGLKKYQLPEWGEYPIFMLSGKSGVALFPAHGDRHESHAKTVGIDHFAFNVTNENFEKAKKLYSRLNLDFSVQDHHYFHSLYTRDPDGIVVELTTIKVKEEDFYK